MPNRFARHPLTQILAEAQALATTQALAEDQALAEAQAFAKAQRTEHAPLAQGVVPASAARCSRRYRTLAGSPAPLKWHIAAEYSLFRLFAINTRV